MIGKNNMLKFLSLEVVEKKSGTEFHAFNWDVLILKFAAARGHKFFTNRFVEKKMEKKLEKNIALINILKRPIKFDEISEFYLKLLMPCPSISPNHFGQVQIVLDGSK